MKKIYSCLLAFLAISSGTTAKTTGISVPNIFPHFGSGGLAAPSGNTQSRIIGQTYLQYNGSAYVPVDSITYSYAFGRGGQLSDDDFNDNFVSFDHSYTYVFDQAQNAYSPLYHRFQEFNQANKVKKYTCQTWLASKNDFKDSARYIYSYNVDQTKLETTQFQLKYTGNWSAHVDYNNFYDASNRCTAMVSIAYKMEMIYDANNNVIERRDSLKYPQQPWKADFKHLFTYNVANQITSYVIEDYDGIWKNYKKYEYAYNGPDLISTIEYEWTNNTWVVVKKNTSTYDSNHHKLIDISEEWDQASASFINKQRLQWVYNSFGQPVTYHSETWDAASGQWAISTDDFMFRYYYESYTPTSVKRFTAGTIKMLLYPQPAKESINVRVDLERPESYTITVFDAQGRVAKHLIGSNININQNIPLQDLPAGNYFLKITTMDKQQTQPFIVVH